MKYYVGTNMRNALKSTPVEIKSIAELRRYVNTNNVVIAVKEAAKMKKRLNIKTPKKPATYEGCLVKPGALASHTPTSRSTTGFRGVYRTGGQGQYKGRYYQARITIHENGVAQEKLLYCGPNLREAIIARLRAEEDYYDKILEEINKEEK